MEEKEKRYTTSNPRISNNLVEYIKFIVKRYLDEYGIKIDFTEASNLLAKRSEETNLFN